MSHAPQGHIRRGLAWLAVILLCALPLPARAEGCDTGQHSFAVAERVAPTATEDGYETLRCTLCGYSYQAVLYATSHLWGPWAEDIPATCTKDGKRHRTCTRTKNAHHEVEAVPALGHEYKRSDTTSTCMDAGQYTYTCARCGNSYTEPGEAALEHLFEETAVLAATCLAGGERTFACVYGCGESYTEPIAPLGHAFGDWAEEQPAEPGLDGLEACVCAACGAREERILPALALPVAEKLPLFNEVDAIAGGVSGGVILLALFALPPYVRTLSRSRRDSRAYRERAAFEEREAKKHDFRKLA
ncbi:MAG: hypothetical protein FWE69_07815 [Clostridiales bacterium]|nr:hypothetical protein [Clostridiales bacterium]